MRRLSPRQFTIIKTLLFIVLLLPAILIASQLPNTSNPIEFLIRQSGERALQILLLTLSITPLQHISGYNWLIKLRRMIGLYTFFYATCHFAFYLFLDLQLDFSSVFKDIMKRRYITLGFIAFILLSPLAVTSNALFIRRMKILLWQRLHNLIYIIAPLAIIHLIWQIKGLNFEMPLIYSILLALLFALRIPVITKKIKR